MPIVPINPGVQSNPGRHPAISDARLINCYVEVSGEEAKSNTPIFASDGFEAWVTLGDGGAVRDFFGFDSNNLYVISGQKLFKIQAVTRAVTEIGDIPGTGLARIARNRKIPNAQMAIAADGRFFIVENDILSEIDIAYLQTGTLVDVHGLNGYFVLIFDNGEFFTTEIDEGTNIDDLMFAQAQGNPDGLLSGAVRGADLCLFGERSTEFWQNTGNVDFPFERTTTASIGCYAAGSVTELVVVGNDSAGDSVAFAATDSRGAYVGVMLLSGYGGDKISTHAVDRSIRDEPDKSSIDGYSWSKDGHTFYCITGSTFTWVFDASTGLWHERKTTGLDRWRIGDAISFDGEVLVGDYTNNKIYRMRHDIYDEDGTNIEMTVRLPVVHSWPLPMKFHALYVDTIPGVGLVSGDQTDIDPVISMRHSNDAGSSWIGPRTARVGASGENLKRVKFLQLGMSREDGKMIELSMSSRVVRTIMGTAVNAVTVKA